MYSRAKLATALGGALALAPAAFAYVGPGAGFAVVTSFFAVFASLALAAFAFLTLPFRRLVRAVRRRRAFAKARVGRVIVLGLDGLSPDIVRKMMAEGKLPNLARLAREGTFAALATTVPAVSPVAWSSFQTGTSPARHNIFDFLSRDRATYLPDLSSARVGPPRRHLNLGKFRVPLGKPSVRLLRKSKPFWKILGDHGVFSNVIRVPITFPPEKFHGVSLSAMCVPDLLGTQGTFSYYSEEDDARVSEGGQCVRVSRNGREVWSYLLGPDNPIKRKREQLRLPFKVKADGDGRATLSLDGSRIKLKVGEYSEWTPVAFRAGLGVRVRGIARFLVMSLEPFAMYVTPVNVDPDRPALPISHPYVYAVYLSKLIGRYATLGLAEDTWALNEGVIDEGEFLEQVWRHHGERERMFFDALAKTRQGAVVCVFDTPDRVQHMFFRYLTPDHPANAGRDTEKYAGAIEEMYAKMDELVGATVAELGPGDLLLVMSDHGFVPFARGVNVNAWLKREGYLVMKDGAEGGKWLAGVDWGRTKAYALGLGGIYVNVKGREARGTVPREDVPALKKEIAEKLAGLRDEGRGDVAVREVYDLGAMYDGPYLDGGPELVVGYNAGYRASWDSATGGAGGDVVEDNVKVWSGDHCVASELVPGVLFSSARVTTARPRIVDIAPTMLDLFGVAVPPYMEGRPLELELTPPPAREAPVENEKA
ncbi:MAG: nucleotide pyrophosphatase [candidate division Zixibacteria bacterium]|nr:nucleotide pyrophosphatase [candidate division Zixibacteria bacterium]